MSVATTPAGNMEDADILCTLKETDRKLEQVNDNLLEIDPETGESI